MSLPGDRLVPRQQEPPDQPMSSRNKDKAHALGLTSAIGLVRQGVPGWEPGTPERTPRRAVDHRSPCGGPRTAPPRDKSGR